MIGERCHVAPEPIEAPEPRPAEPPPPTLPVRNRDLVRYRALLLGYSAAQAKDPKGTLDFEAFAAGVEVALDYLRQWDRRGR